MKEVEVLPTSTYSEVCVDGANAIGVEIEEDLASLSPVDGQLALFHLDGTIIPDDIGWTISSYMSELGRGPSQMKLGVGIMYKVMNCGLMFAMIYIYKEH